MAIFERFNENADTAEALSAEALSNLPKLEFKARRLADGLLSGVHKSRFSGSGSEFKEYAQYQPGDELRHIDWRLFGRTDQLFIRRREDERNLNCTVLLDASCSMNYPLDRADSKFNCAKLIAAALNLFLQRQKDAFALGVLGDEFISWGAPSSRDLEFKHNLDRLNRLNATAKCNLTTSLARAVDKLSRSSVVMIISDFYAETDELFQTLEKLFAERREVVLIRILSPDERDLGFAAPELFADAESDLKMIVRADLLRKEYQRRLRQHSLLLAEGVKSRGGDYLEIYTDESPEKNLTQYLRRRKSARGE